MKRTKKEQPPRPVKIIIAADTFELLEHLSKRTARRREDVVHFALQFYAVAWAPKRESVPPKRRQRGGAPSKVGDADIIETVRKGPYKRRSLHEQTT